ncbi:DUF3540 domain-containing protein [Dongshaea marina]|uniref:DUF3540 domain-containing protein n=1 Tax=Dongshaea marina TaxID=2047966 RepID=UPI000D3E8E93|nr:DUF3540 domain-containing protein [Dongshaea marina]
MMENIAPKPISEPTLEAMQTGMITGMAQGCFEVSCGDEVWLARAAASCLLAPELGDQVLLARAEQCCWILAILQRETSSQYLMQVEGSLSIKARDTLELQGERTLGLHSAGETRMVSEQLSLDTNSAEMRCQSVGLIARMARVSLGTFSQVAERLEQTIESVIARIGQNFRIVREHDEQRSGSHRHMVEDTLTIEAKNCTQVAEQHMTIDAEKIHLG